MNKTALKVSALLLTLGLATGCATTGTDVEETANRAAQAAARAQSTADQALAAATEAQACCEANTERMERMFERSQSK